MYTNLQSLAVDTETQLIIFQSVIFQLGGQLCRIIGYRT